MGIEQMGMGGNGNVERHSRRSLARITVVMNRLTHIVFQKVM